MWPFLLFYGLSQAGRVIAAAATSADAGGWELEGHGINCIIHRQVPADARVG